MITACIHVETAYPLGSAAAIFDAFDSTKADTVRNFMYTSISSDSIQKNSGQISPLHV